jgi:hypothetical protein
VFSLLPDVGNADVLDAMGSPNGGEQNALADDIVKFTRLRNTGSFVFQLRLSGISASWYLIWSA